MSGHERTHRRTAANRRSLADFFDSLDGSQLATPSLCRAWTVREVLGHLTMPMVIGFGRLAVTILRHRGSVDRASEALAREIAERDVTELTGLLRDQAERQLPAPGVGPMGQMADGCIHLRDCARPLGLDTDVPLDDWRMVLDFLPTRQASLSLVPRGRLKGLRLVATDLEWSHGDGEQVSGAGEALAIALTGRRVALADLDGPGAAVLAVRLA